MMFHQCAGLKDPVAIDILEHGRSVGEVKASEDLANPGIRGQDW